MAQKDRWRRKCKATNRFGEPCKRWAMKGGLVCARHGGSTKNSKAKNAERYQEHLMEKRAEREIARLGKQREIHPAEALLESVYLAAGEVDFWREKLDTIDEDDLTWGRTSQRVGAGPEGPIDVDTFEAKPHVYKVMFDQAQEKLVKYSAAALRAGVDERRIQLAEKQGAMVGEVIKRILDRLDLSRDQQILVGEVVPEELRRLG